jgi:ribulose-bisphosphate carboxylase small chain
MQTLSFSRYFETFSYLPPLSDAQITKQLQYMLDQGYIPGVEFSKD